MLPLPLYSLLPPSACTSNVFVGNGEDTGLFWVRSLPNKLELPEENENPVRGPEFNEPKTELSIFLPKLNEALAAPTDGSVFFSEVSSTLLPANGNGESCCSFVDPNREGDCVASGILLVSLSELLLPLLPCCCSIPARYFS